MKQLLDADLFVFDLDGTLADAFGMIAASFNAAMEAFGLPVKSTGEVRLLVGTGSRQLLAPFVPEERLDEALDVFYEEYECRYLDETYPMPGALPLLQALRDRGVKMALASNKRGEHCRAGLERMGMLEYMEVCFGAGDVPTMKPDPAMLTAVLEHVGVSSDRTLMVGDSPIDVASAKAVKMPCLCVTTGSHTREQLEEVGADLVVPDLHAVRGLL